MTAFGRVLIVRAAGDEVANDGRVTWAVEKLRGELEAKGVVVEEGASASGSFRVVVAGAESAEASGVRVPEAAEALALAPLAGEGGTLVSGRDGQGVVYGVLELADRVRFSEGGAEGAVAALRVERAVVERPANAVRSVMRLFASDVEDLGWFHDREFWTSYLDELATQRFNRFNLALGLGYDFPRGVTDSYLYFSYPFLVDVPGYGVRVRGLEPGERERNLETLRFIGQETVKRGLRFQVGLWTHAYEMLDSPDVNYVVEGLNEETHAPYIRDAIRMILKEVPEIGGLTIRTHGESGIAEGSYDFWNTVFEAASTCGRTVELDLHPKGLDWHVIEIALKTGQPVIVAPKYWAEHQGLPYHQTGIRPTERVLDPGRWEQTHMSLSAGSRRFTRYGYADFMREDRQFGMLHRVWPGTQRLLLWGDPLYAASYSRAGGFSGSVGMEWFDPLSFKGRKGSGLPGDRGGYADESLSTPGGGWEKYAYTYRLWGRLLYNPETAPEMWRRALRAEFGAGAEEMEAALGAASRILPLCTSAHLPSAANYGYWVDLPTNMPIVDGTRRHPYNDTLLPKRFGAVSPLDPELFSRPDDYAAELAGASEEKSGKYSPLEVAARMKSWAEEAVVHLAVSEKRVPDRNAPGFRRWATDVRIEAAMGRFYAEKLRAAVAWALFERTREKTILEEGLAAYGRARAGLAAAAEAAEGVYVEDLTFGPVPYLRGTWKDRLPFLDEDLADMQAALERVREAGGAGGLGTTSKNGDTLARWRAALADPGAGRRGVPGVEHSVPAPYKAGEAVMLEVKATGNVAPASVRVYYRHVNQAEAEQVAEMKPAGSGVVRATVSGEYTDSPYPLRYYFEVRDAAGNAALYPGFSEEFENEPYFVLRQG